METTIGLHTELHTFKTHEEMVKSIESNKNKGTVEIVYINNEYGYEFKPYHFIDIGE